MLTTSQAALEVSNKEEQGVLEVSHKENQDLRIGVWMEYFPDWLVGLGRDGISRLLGFLIDGAAVGNLPVKWELWGPTWAYDHLNQFLNELDPKSRRCCRVHRSDHTKLRARVRLRHHAGGG